MQESLQNKGIVQKLAAHAPYNREAEQQILVGVDLLRPGRHSTAIASKIKHVRRSMARADTRPDRLRCVMAEKNYAERDFFGNRTLVTRARINTCKRLWNGTYLVHDSAIF